VKTNAYDDIDPNRWKDLGPKFVLQVARYLSRIGWEDRGFLHGVWPAVKSALSHAEQQDTNGDGLPDNEGIPDQTFDKWPMTGASAYCGGLTVAALVAAREIAEWCGDPGAGKHYDAWCRKAARSLHDALWSGDGFRYDTAPENASLVMAAQLAGEWALAMAGLPGYVEAGTVRRTLESIWQHCACRVEGSLWGLVNGAPLPGSSAPDNRHAREVWTGINYAVASHMILAGMQREAMELIEALSRVTYEDRPFAFRVPEAWDEKGNFRGTLYMRPLAVWAVEEALRRARPDPRLSSFLQTPEG
jgi:non-lysosomal glucosylceramidase